MMMTIHDNIINALPHDAESDFSSSSARNKRKNQIDLFNLMIILFFQLCSDKIVL